MEDPLGLKISYITQTRPVHRMPGWTATPEVDPPGHHHPGPVGRFERQSVLAAPDRSCLAKESMRLVLAWPDWGAKTWFGPDVLGWGAKTWGR